MSKSAILSSSIAKKYWMALTGLFLCVFLIGHLVGNLQLITKFGEEGKRAFNEYAYFMQHNPFIKVLSYVTYLSIVFHSIDGLLLAVQNKKARPQKYAYNKPGTNSTGASRNMAILGTAILIFIVTHMVHFWAKMHFTELPLHTKTVTMEGPMGVQAQPMDLYLTTKGDYMPKESVEVKHETDFYLKGVDVKMGEGVKDLHSIVMAFFGQSRPGIETNSLALVATILYVVSMAILSFHLWHGFASAFQSLGQRRGKYIKVISGTGKVFAIVVPLLFAIIPVLIYLGFV